MKRKSWLKKLIALSGILFAGLFFAIPVNASSVGVLFTAGAGHQMDIGLFDTVSVNRVLSDAGATTAINEMKAAQIEESIAGYNNLGVAQVENHLNVRKGPGEETELAGKMVKNAGCEILDVEGEWAHIKSGKVDGYVNTQYLLTGEEAKIRARQVMTLMATVTTTTLFVREEATTDSSVVTMVPMEEELEITAGEEGDEWVKIVIDEDEGYVNTQYVKISERLENAITMKELRYGEGVSDLRVSIVNYSKQFLGNPYVWGGTSLTKGADCSGYVQSVFRHFNIRLPRTSREQARVGKKISASDAKPGDLFFYGKGGVVNHVAIYIGGGQVINASNPRSGIKISNAYYRTPYAVRRVINE